MSLSREARNKLADHLQFLFDEGWDSGMAYSLIQNGPDAIREEYWSNSETYETRIVNEVLAVIVLELIGEEITDEKDMSDTGDGTTAEDVRGVVL